MPVDRVLFRQLAGSFPTGVTVVTTRDTDGTPKGLTTQSFVGLSTEPPLMMVSVDKSSRTLAALRRSGSFAINFLKAGSEAVSTKFASRDDDKFANLPWVPSSVAAGAPMLTEHSVACAECVVLNAIEAGDHWIFIGRVEGGAIYEGTPLMYFRRTYAGWPEETPGPPNL